MFECNGFATLIASVCVKHRRRSLQIQSISCLLESLYSLCIGAVTGAVINVINFIRSGLFIGRNRFGRWQCFAILVVFDVIIMVNCVLTWAGSVSLLPTIGSLVHTYCLWQTDMRLVRVSGVTTGLSHGAYCVIYGGWLMAPGYTVLLITGVVEIILHDKRGGRAYAPRYASAYHRRLVFQPADSRRR